MISKKILRIITLVSLVLGLTQCQILKGYTGFTTPSDAEGCINKISGDLNTTSNTEFTLHQTFVMAPQPIPQAKPEGCFYHTYYHDSFFYNEPASGNMLFLIQQPNDTNGDFAIDTPLLASDIQKANGSTCVSLPQTTQANLQQYVCKTMFGFTPVDFAVWGTGNLTFSMPAEGSSLTFIEDVLNNRSNNILSNRVTVNSSFPTIYAALYDQCGSTSSNVTKLTDGLTVTTSGVELTDYISGMRLGWVLIKPNGTDANTPYYTSNYRSVPSPTKAPQFGPGTSHSGCYNLGISYGDLLPNLDYCAAGCKVSLVFTDASDRIYTLKTYGLYTAGNATNAGNCSDSGSCPGTGTGTGTGTGNGTGTGTGNGTGSGTNNGTGTGSTGSNNTGGNNNGTGSGSGSNNNNNGGGAANSALSMSVSGLVLLISATYLALV